jgi:hypothetical protein
MRSGLLEALSELCAETGRGPAAEEAPAGESAAEALQTVRLSSEDEALVAGLRAGLTRLAGVGRSEPRAAVRGALDGAEFVARGELIVGHRARLSDLLPSFVFLVLLPLNGSAEALRLSERAARLLERTAASG